MDINELQAEFFKALSNPVRLKILLALRDKDSCVCDLGRLLKEPQPQVTRHLQALKEAGLLTAEKTGTRTCHRIKNREVFKLLEISRDIIKDKNEKILMALEKEKNNG